jgi:hypothetical protein
MQDVRGCCEYKGGSCSIDSPQAGESMVGGGTCEKGRGRGEGRGGGREERAGEIGL